jgi:hypothetical protein
VSLMRDVVDVFPVIDVDINIIHYSNKRNCMQSSSLNNITSIQKYNSRISVILIYYYALCTGSK